MHARIHEFLFQGMRNAARGLSAKVREVNRKYETPHVRTTPAVRVCLVFLKGYIFFLVGVLVYKFYTIVR